MIDFLVVIIYLVSFKHLTLIKSKTFHYNQLFIVGTKNECYELFSNYYLFWVLVFSLFWKQWLQVFSKFTSCKSIFKTCKNNKLFVYYVRCIKYICSIIDFSLNLTTNVIRLTMFLILLNAQVKSTNYLYEYIKIMIIYITFDKQQIYF